MVTQLQLRHYPRRGAEFKFEPGRRYFQEEVLRPDTALAITFFVFGSFNRAFRKGSEAAREWIKTQSNDPDVTHELYWTKD